MSIDTNDRIHWVSIKVHPKLGWEKIEEEYLHWETTWQVRMKWNWYFRYRTALLQVKYPKYNVEMTWGNEPMPKGDQHRKSLENKLIARKRKITEYQSKIFLARSAWTGMFPIESEPWWPEVTDKLSRAIKEKEEFEIQIKEYEKAQHLT